MSAAPATFTLYQDPAAAWTEVVAPWLEAHQPRAWRDPGRPPVVLVPHHGTASFLKAQWLAQAPGSAGLRWVTPGQWRTLARMRVGRQARLARREDLRLLLAMVLAAEPSPTPWHRALARHPEAFLAAFDAWATTGLPLAAFRQPGVRELAGALIEHVAATGRVLTQREDQALEEAARAGALTLGPLLAYGFGPADLTQMPLLRAATRSAEAATVCFPWLDLAEGRDAIPGAEIWLASWEELMGEPTILGGRNDHPKTAPTRFAWAGSREEEARWAVAATARTLAHDPTATVGLVVPRRVPELARAVARLLAAAGLPHDDGYGHLPRPTVRHEHFQAWAAYQREARTGDLLALAAARRDEAETHAGRRQQDLARACARARDELLTVRLGTCVSWWRRQLEQGVSSRDAQGAQVALDFVAAWPRLPAQDALAAMWAVTEPALRALGWGEAAALTHGEIEALAAAGGEVTREAWLDWLAALLREPGRARGAAGRESLSPVRLLAAGSSAGMWFTQTILLGSDTEGVPAHAVENATWPRADRATARRGMLVPARSGEGEVLAQGAGWVFTATEEAAFTRQHGGALRPPARQVAYAGTRFSEHRGEPLSPASSYYAAWRETQMSRPAEEPRKPLGEDALRELEGRTLREAGVPHKTPYGDAEGRAAMGTAYAARRDSGQCFGRYHPGLPPRAEPLSLSATQWESLLFAPEAVWWQAIVGLEPAANDFEPPAPPKTVGNWVHRWLLGQGGRWERIETAEDWRQRVVQAQERTRTEVEAVYREAGRALPKRWEAVYEDAVVRAGEVLPALTACAAGQLIATEWRLPNETQILLPEGRALLVRGKIDLLWAAGSPHGDELWPMQPEGLADVKTSKHKKALKTEHAAVGYHWQLGLYALALSQATGSAVAVYLLQPGKAAPESLQSDDFLSCTAVTAELGQRAYGGSWGQTGSALPPSRGFAVAWPRATLPIPVAVLREQWANTFPQRDFPS